MESIHDVWRLNENGKVEDPKNGIKLATQALFDTIFRNLCEFAASAPMEGNPIYPSGEHATNQKGEKVDIFLTYKIPQKDGVDEREILPPEARRKIRALKGPGNHGLWKISPLTEVTTSDSADAKTYLQEIETSVSGKVKKAKKEIFRKNDAIENNATGDICSDLGSLLKSTNILESQGLEVVLKVVRTMQDGESFHAIEESKQEILKLNSKMKREKKKKLSLKKKLKKQQAEIERLKAIIDNNGQ